MGITLKSLRRAKQGVNSVDITKRLNTISFFTGYGGIERGIELAGEQITHIASCEIEAYSQANLIKEMEAGRLASHPIWTDAKTFPGEQFLGKVDLFTGGFPCQPFSSAGSRNADEDPRHLFPACLRAVESFRPNRILLENVAGLISAKLGGDGWSDPKGTPVLIHVLRELERRGYKTAWGVFSASEAGAPHQRKRVFILGELANTDDVGLQSRGTSRSLQQESRKALTEWDKSSQTTENNSSSRCTEKLADSNGSRISGGGSLQGCQPNRQGIQGNKARNEDSVRSEMQRCSSLAREELANSMCEGSSRPLRNTQDISEGWEGETRHSTEASISERGSKELADCNSERLEGALSSRETHSIQRSEQVESITRHGHIWPTRPGQHQGSMEEPRTKPKLGRTINGASHRVERLRMLGNGVVPQTAAIAWKVLNERLNASK